MHALGWSLGGAIGYYLALEHPSLLASLTISGMTSCFGRRLTAAGECDTSLLARLRKPEGAGGVLAWLVYHPLVLRLVGTEALGWLASQPILFNHTRTDDVMAFHRLQRYPALTKTFAVWSQYISVCVCVR